MKHKWYIRTRILVTLIGFTCLVLLAVGAGFNISLRSYISSRLSSELSLVSERALEQRRSGMHGEKKEEHSPGHSGELAGTSENAVILDSEGELVSVLEGDEEEGAYLADYFKEAGITKELSNEIISLGNSSYTVSLQNDPVKEGQYVLSYIDVTSLTVLLGDVNRMLGWILMGAVLLAALLSLRFAKSVAGPVQTLSAFAQDIGKGNLKERNLSFQDTEFDQLAESMNRMTVQLEAAREKQETFFQNVSHELRTPLTSIRGNAEGIVCQIMEPKAAAAVILSEADKLGGMLEDILYLSRITKASSEEPAELLDLREVLSLCMFEQKTAADAKGIEIRYDFEEEPVLLSIRESDAQRLFSNLISNAVRYAEKEITLTCRRENDHITVAVSDDGPGISEEDSPHIFERFYKGKDGIHGIGLSIAKAVTESRGGTLRFYNRNGAVFQAEFPLPVSS